jgi:uncharacterized membrane protein YhhN
MTVVITLIIIVSVSLYIKAEYAEQRRLMYIFKPLSTSLIILFCALQKPMISPVYQYLIFFGLVCSLAGDIFLMLPSDQFIAGLVSFLIAHVFYIVAFTSQNGFHMTWPFLFMIVLLAGIILQVILPRVGRLAGPVILYMVGILMMLWQALERWYVSPDIGTLLAVAGAALFVFSDFTLAYNRFVSPFRSARFLNLTTYFAAQWCLALSVKLFG